MKMIKKDYTEEEKMSFLIQTRICNGDILLYLLRSVRSKSSPECPANAIARFDPKLTRTTLFYYTYHLQVEYYLNVIARLFRMFLQIFIINENTFTLTCWTIQMCYKTIWCSDSLTLLIP